MGGEIELIDLLLVLWKRKWLIIIGTLICGFVAGVIAFNMPKIYEISTSIEMGRAEDELIEETPVISRKIRSTLLREKIARELSIPIEAIGWEGFFEISSEEGEKSLVVTTTIETDQPDQGIKILKLVNQATLNGHQKKTEEARKEFSHKIALIQTKIKDIEARMESLKKELSDKIVINERWIEIKEQKQKMLEKQLLDIQRDIVSLQQIRNRITEGQIEKVDVVGMVAYFNDFQARLESLYHTRSQIVDQIPSQIQSYRENITTLQARLVWLDDLPLKIQSYKEVIATLQGGLEKIKETKVIDPPHGSLFAVKPKKVRILAIAGIAGLIISIFFAFLFDYVEKYRRSKA